MSKMTFGSLFSGVGGFDIGLERAGFQCKWQCEVDEKCNKVLEKHWPEVKRYKDVRTIGKQNAEPVNLICGGFPCQDVSLAGDRAGLNGKRSTLWSEFFRIICELKPEWVMAENVFGLLSSDNGRFFGNILRDLASIGYDAEWQVLPAQKFGAPHRRERIYIVAYPNGLGREIFNFKESWRSLSRYRMDNSKQIWGDTKPANIRMDNGVPIELDKLRVRQMGNAVVPQIPEWIGKRIMEVENV